MTMAEFLAMGKHGVYVWSSYALVLAGVMGYVLYIKWVGKQVRKSLLRRIQARRKQNDATT